jgi:UDP-N-acetylmuramyl pentapeptide phosphotransferase/UDP-N-acetylglucosamine-1-phosphate transferase
MLATAHSHPPTLIWGIMLIVVGIVHLVFRRYFARRTAAIQRAKRDTAITPLRRLTFGTDESRNVVRGTIISAGFVLVGLVMIVVSLS